MESVLIVSNNRRNITFFTTLLRTANYKHIHIVDTGAKARQKLFVQKFDLILIDAPLMDESGQSLSMQINHAGIGLVILCTPPELFERMAINTEQVGVVTLSHPLNESMFWSMLKFADAITNRLHDLESENRRLSRKIEDIKVINQAKNILIHTLNINEQEAHRYIEKQAMNERKTRREIAEDILQKQEDNN